MLDDESSHGTSTIDSRYVSEIGYFGEHGVPYLLQ